MPKRTYASVTEEPCTCGYLQHAADDPDNPINFDVRSAEFQFSYGGAMLVIYHCPFCGGAAPESKRDRLFAQISEAEQNRLLDLLSGVQTIDDALQKFGKPDFEGVSTSKYAEREGKAPGIEAHRNIRYCDLSEVAEVWFTERPDGKIYARLQGKYLGNETGNASAAGGR